MFWRLFITYLALVTAAVLLVGILVLQRAAELFWVIALDVAVAVGMIVLLSIAPAYVLARRFTQPLERLSVGAQRLAEFARRQRRFGRFGCSGSGPRRDPRLGAGPG